VELRVVCECVYKEEHGVTLLVDAGPKPGGFLFYPLSWWQEGTVVTSASQFGSGGVAAALREDGALPIRNTGYPRNFQKLYFIKISTFCLCFYFLASIFFF